MALMSMWHESQLQTGSPPMGNATSNGKPLRVDSFSSDPTAFRVFVKKRNKFIPGWLKVNDEEIAFFRTGTQPQFWPLAFLRRYGFTCAGVFFFESGRRCATGEGLHTFQSHQAEKIFHVVQNRIRSEEFARSRAISVAQYRLNGFNASQASTSSKIHPVQRFSSEGAANPFLLRRPSSTRRTPLNVPMMHSNSSGNVHSTRELQRPRSVVSAIEYDVNRIKPAVNVMNSSYSSVANSCYGSAQQLEGEIVNEHVLNQSAYQVYQPYGPSFTPLAAHNYHSYVNVDLPEGRFARETSVTSDANSTCSARPYRPSSAAAPPLMSRSMLVVQPAAAGAFSPPGEPFPEIDRGRSAGHGTPARPIPIPQKPPMEYMQVPYLNRAALTNGFPKRNGSIGQRSECSSVISLNQSLGGHSTPATSRVNYALIDFNKTKALEQLASVRQKAAEKLKHHKFIRRDH